MLPPPNLWSIDAMKKLLLILLVALICGPLALLFFMNAAVKKAIEYGGTYAMGVETSLDAADVSLFSGQVTLEGLAVDNPEGFKADHFFALGQGHLALALGSLTTDTVEIKDITLTGLAIDLDKNSKGTNYDVILENLSRLGGRKGEPTPESREAEEHGKKLEIDHLAIRDVVATVQLTAAGGELTRVTIKVPEIVVEDFGSETDMGALFSIIVRSVLSAVATNAGGLLPSDMLNDLNGKLKDLGSVPFKVTGEVVQTVQDVVGDTAKHLTEATKKIGEAGKKLEEGLGNLLGGDKD